MDEQDPRQIQFGKGIIYDSICTELYYSTGEALGYAMGPCTGCATYGASIAQVTQDVRD